jgi:hypothetical protein
MNPMMRYESELADQLVGQGAINHGQRASTRAADKGEERGGVGRGFVGLGADGGARQARTFSL